jgi:tripartite-type tricarboxylate transporter receptor subunit TctC
MTAWCAFGMAGQAAAQPEVFPRYPVRMIRIIVAESPGTATDIYARVLGEELATRFGQQVQISNRTGAGGLIGNTALSQAAPDGYTLGMVSVTRLVTEIIRDRPPYRALDDTTAITQVASMTNIIAVTPALPVRKLQDLVAYARARPGDLNYASLGIGHASHIAAGIFSRNAGLDVVHVPFRGLNDLFIEMFLGRVHYCVLPLPSIMPVLLEGKLRALAVTTDYRTAMLPQVPTVIESGLPAAQFDNWAGIVAPAGVPRRLVEQLHGEISRALRRERVRDLFARQGAEPTPDSTPDVFFELMRSDYPRYREIMQKAEIRVE